MSTETVKEHVSTQNACKLCTPLGASLVFKGIERAIPMLHGSQGCATYIRRYLISHFKEPIDIACSNFGEETAIFGGGINLKVALENLTRQYHPALIGVATTCLSETIGDDVKMFISEYRKLHEGEEIPELIHVSSPSYQGTHMEGFHGCVKAVVEGLAVCPEKRTTSVNLFPGMLSPADLRYLKEIMADFETPVTLLPDYSETLDGGPWKEYEIIPPGGTPVAAIRAMGGAAASFSFGKILTATGSYAGKVLSDTCNVPCYDFGLPIGVAETDRFFKTLSIVTGRPIPKKHQAERGRLLDSYVDGHKYVMDARVLVFGEEDLVVGICGFLKEIGARPVMIASGGRSGHFKAQIEAIFPGCEAEGTIIMEDADFVEMEAAAKELAPDVAVGNSKGYAMTRRLDIPLLRVGFPIHDRVGGPRQLHVGYRGTQSLFDSLSNLLMEKRQTDSDVGYSYM